MSDLVLTNIHNIIPRNKAPQPYHHVQPVNNLPSNSELKRHLMGVRGNIAEVNKAKEELQSKVFNLTK